MSEETKLSGPAFTPAQHIEAFYYVPDLIKRELPPEAVFSLHRVKLYILLIYTIYSSAESFIVCTERVLTEEGEHEDAVIPYSQLVGVLKVIPGHEVVLLDGERRDRKGWYRGSVSPLVRFSVCFEELRQDETYHDSSGNQRDGRFLFAPLGFVVRGQSGGDAV